MIYTAKFLPSKPHQTIIPIFAQKLKDPTEAQIIDLYKKLVRQSNGKNPGFWSSRTPLEYISSGVSIAGAISSIFGQVKENKPIRDLGVGLILFSIGTFVYNLFKKVQLKPPARDELKTTLVNEKDIETAKELNNASINELAGILNNKELDFYKREIAYIKLHKSLSKSSSAEYDMYLKDLANFQAIRESTIELYKKKIKDQTTLIKSLLQSDSYNEKRFEGAFSKLLSFAEDKSLPVESRSRAIIKTVKIVKENWIGIKSISKHVKELLSSLFVWAEESQRHIKSDFNLSSSQCLETISALGTKIRENSDRNGHDLSNYDDLIPKLEELIKSPNYQQQEAARIFIETTKHTLGLKPLIESLRSYDPSQISNRISKVDYRNRIIRITKDIIDNSDLIVGSNSLIKQRLEDDVFNYLSDENKDIVIAACRLSDSHDIKVRRKLIELLDDKDPILKLTLLDILEKHTDEAPVRKKLFKIIRDEDENPFIKYKAAKTVQSTNQISAESLLIESLKSSYMEIVNNAAFELKDFKSEKIIMPLVEAGKKGSLNALFTLYEIGILVVNSFNVKEFLQDEFSKHLKNYSTSHINHRLINVAIEKLKSSEVIEA